jgi:serine-type D-Ala-D-Ala carboxypeptidase/endopeptidase (penicillin-binding protein 4)
MGGIVPRRLVVLLAALGLAAATAPPASPTPPAALQLRLAQALRVPHVSPARSGALAVDLSSGAVVYTQNGSRPFAPASNEKLPVTYAALALLGPSYRFETDVFGQGWQDGSVWRGALVLRGGGDPTLTHYGLRSLASKLHAVGIRTITGGVVADESWFDGRRTVAGWKASFYINESPPLSALVVDRDRSHSSRPALAAGLAFRRALRSAGIVVGGVVRVGVGRDYVEPLASIVSPPLFSILRFMDRESDNFTAEMLLKQLGAAEASRGTSAAGAAVVSQALAAAGVPLEGVRIVDGSGLSELDRLTPAALAALLQSAWKDPTIHAALLAALPVAGVNGTLADRMRHGPAHGTVLAKTGTTNEASALSGFVRNRYAFSILQNGHPVSAWWARVAQDRFAQVLAAQ